MLSPVEASQILSTVPSVMIFEPSGEKMSLVMAPGEGSALWVSFEPVSASQMTHVPGALWAMVAATREPSGLKWTP